MDESLFSPMWFRAANLSPRLNPNVRVRRQPYRGEFWYLLVDEGTDRAIRVSPEAYRFVGLCDGRRSVQSIWDQSADRAGDALPSQQSVLRLMLRLNEAGMLSFDRNYDLAAVFERRRAHERTQRRSRLNPLYFRVRLGDPSRVLRAVQRLGPLLFNARVLWWWLPLMLAAGLAALIHLDAILVDFGRVTKGPHFLLLAWLLYPPLKLLHELAHGVAVRRWGGEVREWGISLLLLTPLPFVDASAANAFRSARRRAIVSAAGIFAELTVAALALALWLVVEPGLLRDAALALMLMASVSTLLVNGNPLLRFDAYYVLSDLLELPNLAQRSRRWWIDRMRRRVFGTDAVDGLRPARGERPWLVLYQPLSWLYRVALCAGIALWLGERIAWLGYLCGAWFAWTLLLAPWLSAARELLDDSLPEGARTRARLALAVLLIGLPAALFALPVPNITTAQAVVWLPDEAHLRAAGDGFVASLLRRDGDLVEAGEAIVLLHNDELAVRRESLVREFEGAQTEWYGALRSDPAQAVQVEKQIESLRAELARAEQQIEHLTLRAARGGRLVLPRQADLPGRFVTQGELLGLVMDRQPARLRVVVPHDEAARLQGVAQIHARLAEAPGTDYRAELIGQIPSAVARLPSAALGAPAGGPFEVDAGDAEGLATLEPVVWVDLQLPDYVGRLGGGRALVRFDHGRRSIAMQLLRRLRQVLLSRFDPTGAVWIR